MLRRCRILRPMMRPKLTSLRVPLLVWSTLALFSIFLHGPLPLYSTRTLAVAWDMWDQGSWLVPQFNGAPYSHKTPLLPWLIHAGWFVGGVSDIWPRLLMVILGGTVIAQAGVLAGRLYPSRANLPSLTAWAMAGFWFFFMFSLQVMYELPLTVAVLGGLLALCRRRGDAWIPWWPGLALAIGFGLLAKGPVALLHLGVPLLTARWWHPSARADGTGFAKKALWATLAGIGLFSLWLVPALTLGDPQYREALLVTQTAGRIKDSFDHAEPWWWYAPMLMALMAPWCWSRWWWGQVPASWRDTRNRFAWCWLLGMVLGFSLISGKQPYYLLPDFTALALLLAVAADARPRLGIAAPMLLLLVGSTMLCARLFAGRIGQPFPDELLTSVPIAGAVLVLVGIALLRWRSLPAHAFGLLLAITTLHAAVTPLLKSQFDFTPTARLISDAQRNGSQVAFVGEYQLQFHFAGRLHAPLLVLDEADGRSWSLQHPDQLLVVNTLDASTPPGPQPIAQQRFRTRWIQVWRAGQWRALPAQQLPLRPGEGELRVQPR
jgi:4-amino-4-deoxy-L-arabinose transferase-like glycosyltransferase